MGRFAAKAIFGFWLLAVGGWLFCLWLYNVAPAKEGNPPDRWPASSALRRVPGAGALLMFVHPKCACSRASISELAVLLAHSGGRLQAQVVFLKPLGQEDSWTQTDLWRDAAKLPGITLINDLNGREAKMFRVASSGETLVYDGSGNLKFHGGITGARGHIGDNAGCSAIVSYAHTGTISLTKTQVFGCSLFNESTPQQP